MYGAQKQGWKVNNIYSTRRLSELHQKMYNLYFLKRNLTLAWVKGQTPISIPVKEPVSIFSVIQKAKIQLYISEKPQK